MPRFVKVKRVSLEYPKYVLKVLVEHNGRCSSKELAQGVAKLVGLNPKSILGPSQVKGLPEALASVKNRIIKSRDGKIIVYELARKRSQSSGAGIKPKNKRVKVISKVEKISSGDETFLAFIAAFRRMMEHNAHAEHGAMVDLERNLEKLGTTLSDNLAILTQRLASLNQHMDETAKAYQVELQALRDRVSRHDGLYAALAEVDREIAVAEKSG